MSEEQFIPKTAPNYTNAFLTMMGAITFMSLWVIAGLFGFIWVILTALGLECAFRLRRGSGS